MYNRNSYDSQVNTPYKILIVEDDISFRNLEKAILLAPEFDVIEARNGDEALLLIQEQEFDAILVDKRMSGMDGDELCYRVRHDLKLPLLPLIMVTGTNSSDELEKSLYMGVNDFIYKPCSPPEFLARVRAAVNHKCATNQRRALN